MNRAIVIVLDGVGAGAAPDAADFGDPENPSTLRHVWEAVGGFDAPHLAALGFLQAGGIAPRAMAEVQGCKRCCRLKPLSKGGKDSVTGHWEMMGIVEPEPFPTYPDGFPIPLLKDFERRIGTQTLGNRPASGTQIIAELGRLHLETGFPIVYTSADSVFQIACHEEIVPVEQLYEYCRIAREVCVYPNHVQRVIARPFVGSQEQGFTRTERRKDYPLPPPSNLVDAIGSVCGIGVVPELFGGRGFVERPRTQSNPEHFIALQQALGEGHRFVFANFEDTDMLFGHRNDPTGFARCLEEFDGYLARILAMLSPGDLLIVTADHGNDPTDASTDHSREFIPVGLLLRQGESEQLLSLGDLDGFACIGATVAGHLGVPFQSGQSLLSPPAGS